MAFFDFEDGLIPAGWTQHGGAEKSWVITASDAYAGTYCIKADTITDNQRAAIEFTIPNCAAGNMTFYVRVSSESGFDFFRLYIDDIQIEAQARSGSVAWTLATVAITAGSHLFRFSYTKDASVSVGLDTAWVDNITIPTQVFPVSFTTLTLTPVAPFLLPIRPPAAALTLTPVAPFLLPIRPPAAALTLTPVAPTWIAQVSPPSADLTLIPLAPTAQLGYSIPAASLTLTPQNPNYTLAPPGNAVLRSVFRVYLTLPGEPDLELPARSFQARNRLTTRNYLAVVVPDPLPYIDAISARRAGRLVIKTGFALADGTEVLQEIASGVFSDFRYDIGPFNGSATLVGYDYRAPGASLTRKMRGISFRGMNNSGARRVRCDLDMYLKPGDTADLGDDETMIVDQVAYTVSARQAVMEISEAESDEEDG
jgi:hypothetical protein